MSKEPEHPLASPAGPTTRNSADASTTSWPAVTVILPVYNGEAVIAACLDSLLALVYPDADYEIVVVDNASTDATAVILERYRDRLRILYEAGHGVSRARNAAIAATDRDIIAFIDADCIADPGWLSALVRPLLRDADLSVVGGRILALAGANAIARYGEHIHDHRMAIEVYKPAYVISMNIAVRRSVFDDIGVFDPLFLRAQDADLSFRLNLGQHRLAYANDAVIRHHNETTLWSLFREGFKHGSWQICLYRKYADTLTRNRPRLNTRDYKRLGRMFAAVLRSAIWLQKVEPDDVCELVFFSGKKLGHAAGSIRFRHLRL